MAVRPIRRLAPPSGPSLHDRLAAEALHCVYSRRDLDRIEREHPDLVVERHGNVIAAIPAGETKLAYAFTSDIAFVEHFPPMLDQLVPRIRRALAADTVRYRLSHNPSRPIVEPVLKKAWFTPKRRWIEFSIDRRAVAVPAAPRSVKFREATAADADAMAHLDLEAFPDTPEGASSIRPRLESGNLAALLATARDEPIGFCSYAQPDPGEGYVHTLAVTESRRNEGIGEALTLRALKRLFADGAQRVALTTDDDNANAIRLYMKLGFRQSRAGVDYERPTDPRAIRRMQQRSLGTLIKFGGWR